MAACVLIRPHTHTRSPGNPGPVHSRITRHLGALAIRLCGQITVALIVDGRELRAPSLETTREGIVVRAIHEEVPDSHTLVVTVSIPQVNLDSEPQTAAGFAVLTTARTSIEGPGLVSGPISCSSCGRWRSPPR